MQGISFTETTVQINRVEIVCFSMAAIDNFCILYVLFCLQCTRRLHKLVHMCFTGVYLFPEIHFGSRGYLFAVCLNFSIA